MEIESKGQNNSEKADQHDPPEYPWANTWHGNSREDSCKITYEFEELGWARYIFLITKNDQENMEYVWDVVKQQARKDVA